jgi:hypothetical protein
VCAGRGGRVGRGVQSGAPADACNTWGLGLRRSWSQQRATYQRVRLSLRSQRAPPVCRCPYYLQPRLHTCQEGASFKDLTESKFKW